MTAIQQLFARSSSTKFHIPTLDGIRAIAFILVFFAHAGLRDWVPGGFGVTIFFFLSGYLITTLLRIEYEKTSTISLRNFYLRRVYRIFPPLYITLAAGAFLTISGVFDRQLFWPAVLSQIAHVTNYYMVFVGREGMVPSTTIYWSLAVEEHFYLIFPVALVLLLRGRSYNRVATVLALTAAVVLFWRCVLVFGLGVGHSYTYHATDARFDSLLFGCILGIWGNPFLEKNDWLEQGGSSNRQFSIVILSLGMLLFCLLFRNDQFRNSLRYTIQGIALFPLFYYAVSRPNWKWFSWLEWSGVRAIGVLSYTLYLSHLIALGIAGIMFEDDGQTLGRGILGFVLALAYSMIMFVFVEKPAVNLRRRLHRD